MSNGSTVSCSACAFYIQNAANPGNGWCRASPPLAMPTSAPQYASKVQWPQVGSNEWCGDYAAVFPPPPSVLTRIATQSSVLIKTGPGLILSIAINQTAGANFTVYDGIDATGAIMAVINTNSIGYNFGPAPWPFHTGLFVNLSQNAGVTVISQ